MILYFIDTINLKNTTRRPGATADHCPHRRPASRDEQAPGRTHSKHRHVCATQSAIGAHFVKPLIPGHIPASFPKVGRDGTPPPGWGGAYIALFTMCASRDERPLDAHMGS